METVKTVGIRNLKNSLSAYIREVKNGTVILITDHGHVVAEMRTPVKEYEQIRMNKISQEWIESGKLRLPLEPKNKIGRSSVSLPAGTSIRVLDLDRQE